MRGRTILVLVVLAVAGWLAWLLWLRSAPSVEERRASAGLVLPGLDAAAVNRITIERADGTIALSKTGDRWKLDRPVEDAGQQTTVEQLLRDLADAKALARIPPAEIQGGAEAAGLGAGATHVVLEGAGGRRELTLGTAEIPGRRRYARVAGAAALALVDDSLADSVGRSVDDFRDHDLFRLSAIDISRWRMDQSGGAPLIFERRGGENWWIVAPIVDAADNLLAGGALSRILSLRADHFLDRPAPGRELGLDPPAVTVQLFDAKGGVAGVLRLGLETENGRRYGSVEGRRDEFEVYASELLHELARPPAEFRSKVALDAAVYDIAEVELARGAAVVAFRRVQGAKAAGDVAWELKIPASFPFDPQKAADVVSRLAHIEVRRLADDVTPEAAGLTPPRARLTVLGEDARRLPRAVVEVGGPAGQGEVYARREGRPAVLVLDEKIARDIDPAAVKR